MDEKRKKELLLEYKNRKPEKGIISYRCKETNESFLMASNDTKVSFSSTSAKLSMNYHPNKRLLELWNKYGAEGFELTVLKVLKYEDPNEDYSKKLDSMLVECLDKTENSQIIWK